MVLSPLHCYKFVFFLEISKHNSVDLFIDYLTIIVVKLVVKFYAVSEISQIYYWDIFGGHPVYITSCL